MYEYCMYVCICMYVCMNNACMQVCMYSAPIPTAVQGTVLQICNTEKNKEHIILVETQVEETVESVHTALETAATICWGKMDGNSPKWHCCGCITIASGCHGDSRKCLHNHG